MQEIIEAMFPRRTPVQESSNIQNSNKDGVDGFQGPTHTG